MNDGLDRKRLSEFSQDELRNFRRRWDRWEMWLGIFAAMIILGLYLIFA